MMLMHLSDNGHLVHVLARAPRTRCGMILAGDDWVARSPELKPSELLPYIDRTRKVCQKCEIHVRSRARIET